tara:strand:+ start:2547 stop:3818 length:1272 start_codon:yes stop_codon:yes gene_type:complete
MSFLYKLLLYSFFCIALSQSKVDGIAAIVGNNIVLHSDVLQQAQFIAMEGGVDPSKNPYMFEKIYLTSLDNLINQYIVLNVAEKDTNLIITSDEVDRALDQQINDFILRAGSEKLFLEMVGMSMREIRGDYWKDIRDMMYVERFQYSLIQNIDVSRIETINFFNTYKDSLPQTPEKYDFSVIEIPFLSSKKTEEEAVSFLKEIKNNIIQKGQSFDSLAIKYSDDPGSSFSGGYLGFTKRGTLVKEYEKAAYSMEVGEISDPVKSDFGFHLIKLIDRQGEKISTQHILKLNHFSENDKNVSLDYIDSIYQTININKSSFDSLSVYYSKKYKNNSGTFLNKQINEIPVHIYSNLKEYPLNKLLPPIETEDGFILIYLYNYKPAIKPSIENSWNIVYNFAKQKKQNDFFISYVDKIKKYTYIKIFN